MSDTDTPAKPPRAARKSAARKPSGKRAPRKPKAASEPAPAVEKERKQVPRGAQDDRPCDEAAATTLIRVPMPVRWRDLDAFNHVNNSKYLSYLEEARLQWMLGLPGQGMDEHVAPVVAAAQLNFRRPIEWPAQIMVKLFVQRLGNTSLSVGHRIVAADDAAVLYCEGHVVMVWIDRDSGTAAPLPGAVREACA